MKRKTLKRIYDDNGVLTHKECGVCGDMKSVEEFYKSGQLTKSNDSFDSRCKSCVRGYKKTHLHKRIEINKKNPAKYFDDNGNTLTKYCPHCKKYKYRTDFSIKNNNTDGLNTYCKDCHNELKQKTIEFNKNNPVKYNGDDGVPLKKRCTKCKEEKSLKEFHENYRYAGGLHTQCKSCVRGYKKTHLHKRIEINKKNPAKYFDDNGNTLTKYCPHCKKYKYRTDFSIKNNNTDGLNTYCKTCKSEVYYRDREANQKRSLEYHNKRIKTDPLYRFKKSVCRSVARVLRNKGIIKNKHTEEIIGCSHEFFKSYIESKFEPWMTWENHGKYKKGEYKYGWDIDHIIPMSSADTQEEAEKLCHYTNLQPLCSKINRDVKGKKLDFYM